MCLTDSKGFNVSLLLARHHAGAADYLERVVSGAQVERPQGGRPSVSVLPEESYGGGRPKGGSKKANKKYRR